MDIGHLEAIDRERIEIDPPLRLLLGTGVLVPGRIAAHEKPAGRHRHHPFRHLQGGNPLRHELGRPGVTRGCVVIAPRDARHDQAIGYGQ